MIARNSPRKEITISTRYVSAMFPAEVLRWVADMLDNHRVLHGHLGTLELDYEAGTLILKGQLPSFHLKQVLQTALRGIPSVDRIENRVDVVSSRGLSSVSRRESTFP